jgi:hypothetical protein
MVAFGKIQDLTPFSVISKITINVNWKGMSVKRISPNGENGDIQTNQL